MKLTFIAATIALSGIAFTSSAQTDATTTTTTTPVAAAAKVSTIPADRKRIKQGAQSGELTKAETARLANQTAKLKNEKQDIKADGVVTTEERKDYRKDKRKVSRNIYRQKHDSQTRP